MAKVFYLSEIVKFAVEKEIESEELYQKLHDKASKVEAKELFAFLVGEEKKHEALYRKMLESVASEQTPGVSENSEYFDYMQEMINAGRAAGTLAQYDDLKKACEFAIAREKDSVLFYLGLKNFVQAQDKAKVDVIIAEEGHHIAMLLKLKATF